MNPIVENEAEPWTTSFSAPCRQRLRSLFHDPTGSGAREGGTGPGEACPGGFSASAKRHLRHHTDSSSGDLKAGRRCMPRLRGEEEDKSATREERRQSGRGGGDMTQPTAGLGETEGPDLENRAASQKTSPRQRRRKKRRSEVVVRTCSPDMILGKGGHCTQMT